MTPFANIAVVIFWISTLGVFVTYIGVFVYSCLLKSINRRNKQDSTTVARVNQVLPDVTVLVPAFNEESVIANRIENLLRLDYPKSLLKIMIVSDLSTDRTAEIVQGYSKKGVDFFEMQYRSGKLGILDNHVPLIKTEIVIISDANVEFEKDSVNHIVKAFSDKRVGAVSGNQMLIPPQGSNNLEGEHQYQNYERFVKEGMSTIGRVIGVAGGFYAFRKRLFRSLGKTPAPDDMIIPMEVLAQGYRVEYCSEAIAREETTKSVHFEFKRRLRMAAFNFSGLKRVFNLALKAGFHTFILTFSYKILRWFSPFLLLTALLSSILLFKHHFVFQVAVLAFSLCFAITFIGALFVLKKIEGGPVSGMYHFVSMNFAGLIGPFGALKGLKRHWNPRGASVDTKIKGGKK